jgi:DNA polymerase III gamma/tau subunit
MRGYLTAVVGNDRTRARLGESVVRGTVSHAYLIEGPSGSGKHTLALELAAAMNCERREGGGALPCHSCNNCRRIMAREFPDVKYLAKAKDKATIGVGEVSDFKEDMYLSATEAKHKIYVIESAELLTPQAQNSLLITLEEPPRGVVIVHLCEQADKLLTTIRSRVQYIAMERFSSERIEDYLAEHSGEARRLASTDKRRLDSIVLAADGCIGQALRLTDPRLAEENERRRSVTEEIVRAMAARTSYSALLSAMGELSQKRAELSAELESIMQALRDMIAKKLNAEAKPLFFTSDAELCELVREFDLKRLNYLFDAVCDAYEDNQKNANIAMLITSLTTKIKK